MVSTNRGHLLTEQINTNSTNLDQLSPLEIVDLFNQEDQKTIDAIALCGKRKIFHHM